MKEGNKMNDAKRTHILETAMQLFNESGFHATPTSKIAKKSKISVGTLFNYFPTKEELIQAIYIEIKIHSRNRFLEQIEEKSSNHDTLQSMWKAVITWGIENPEEFNYLESFSSSTFRKSFQNDKVMDSYSKFRDSILKSTSAKTKCLSYPEYYMSYIDNSIHAATRFILNNKIDDVDEFIDASFDLIWLGFSQK